MSAGTIIGGVVGAVVGFFVGGPAGAFKGAQLGMTIGGALDPVKGPNITGPRLSDLTVQTSSLGAIIARAYGNVPITGNVFWLENNKLKEKKTKKSSGGKGGGGSSSVTTFSYFATFAVGLCKGPIVGIRRIWVGGMLAYDPMATSQDTIRASNQFAKYFTLYTGAETQNPDPRMQSTLGVANTPAYRGLAYIVFKDLPLAKYQNSLARAEVKVEVIKEGTVSANIATTHYMLSNPAGNINTDSAWNEGCGLFMVVNQVGSGNTYQISKTGETGTWSLLTAPYSPVSGASGRVVANKERFFWRMGYDNYTYISKNGKSWTRTLNPNGPGYYSAVCDDGDNVMIFPNEYRYDNKFSKDGGKTWITGLSFAQYMPYGGFNMDGIAAAKGIFIFAKFYHVTFQVLRWEAKTNQWSAPYVPAQQCAHCSWVPFLDKFLIWSQFQDTNVAGTYQAAYSSDGKTWTYTTVPTNGSKLIVCNDRVYMPLNASFYYVSYDLVTWTQVTLPSSINEQAGQWNGAIAMALGNGTKMFHIRPRGLATDTIPLSEIVSNELILSGLLQASDFDVTALTANVRGYRIGRVTTLRAALEPLQAMFPFDIIQSGYKIKFKQRTGSSVVTIPKADLAARQGE